MRRLLTALLVVALPLAVALAHAQSSGRPSAGRAAGLGTSGLQLDALDRTADPCVDFYQFACGGWLAKNPVPADRASWGRFEELQERNDAILHGILDAAAPGRDPETKKIGDYYASCMDEAAIDARGSAPLDAELKKIDALARLDALPPLVAELQMMGADVFFAFGSDQDFNDANMEIAEADQGGLGLPERDYYFRTDAKSQELRTQYVEHVGKLFDLLRGTQPANGSNGVGAQAADTVMRIETALAKASLDVVTRRDPTKLYHKMAVADLQALSPAFDWQAYFRALNAPAFTSLNVVVPDYFKALNTVLTTTPLADLKTYLRWHLAHSAARMLSKPFVDENFRFYGTILTGQAQNRDRWKRCVAYTDRDLGEALGKEYVKVAFGPKAKEDTLKMVGDIETALGQDIQSLDWMTDATKQQALVKLRAIANKIGYPDRWRDYSALSIVRGDALGNVQRSAAFETHRDVNKIGKPVDRMEWGMTPPTVNAYYSAQMNNINFPAGILQPPFYSATTDAAVNYGGAGAVIGHELTHGFDDQGRQFDAVGNLRDWWTPADAKAFEERAQCLVDEYSSFTAVDDVHVNGKLTLGENTADNGGVRIALMAYLASHAGAGQQMDGFTPEQRLFLGWGQIWCENRRPEVARLYAQTDEHSPGRDRINGVVSNMPEFQKAFACKADAPMVRHPACRVW